MINDLIFEMGLLTILQALAQKSYNLMNEKSYFTAKKNERGKRHFVEKCSLLFS